MANENTADKLIKLLNNALRLEYGIIIHMPKIINRMSDKAIAELAQKLSEDSVRHADTVASIITDLGGDPDWTFEPDPVDKELKDVFQEQLDKEIFAVKAYEEGISLTLDDSLKEVFSGIVNDEKEHITIVNQILEKLD